VACGCAWDGRWSTLRIVEKDLKVGMLGILVTIPKIPYELSAHCSRSYFQTERQANDMLGQLAGS
jgi:hypothetical protein